MVSDPVLELKIELLHHCLEIQGAQEILANPEYTNMLEEVHQDKTLRMHIENLVNIGDNLTVDYINQLTDIRVYLLGS